MAHIEGFRPPTSLKDVCEQIIVALADIYRGHAGRTRRGTTASICTAVAVPGRFRRGPEDATRGMATSSRARRRPGLTMGRAPPFVGRPSLAPPISPATTSPTMAPVGRTSGAGGSPHQRGKAESVPEIVPEQKGSATRAGQGQPPNADFIDTAPAIFNASNDRLPVFSITKVFVLFQDASCLYVPRNSCPAKVSRRGNQ